MTITQLLDINRSASIIGEAQLFWEKNSVTIAPYPLTLNRRLSLKNLIWINSCNEDKQTYVVSNLLLYNMASLHSCQQTASFHTYTTLWRTAYTCVWFIAPHLPGQTHIRLKTEGIVGTYKLPLLGRLSSFWKTQDVGSCELFGQHRC